MDRLEAHANKISDALRNHDQHSLFTIRLSQLALLKQKRTATFEAKGNWPAMSHNVSWTVYGDALMAMTVEEARDAIYKNLKSKMHKVNP